MNEPGKNDTIHSASGVFANIPAGNYMLRLKDQRGCRILLDADLIIYRTSDCDPVISPLDGGQQSSYFIDKPGVVRIFDMNGNVIREFTAPATWDGTGTGGDIVTTGYYVITIDNKNLPILRLSVNRTSFPFLITSIILGVHFIISSNRIIGRLNKIFRFTFY